MAYRDWGHDIFKLTSKHTMLTIQKEFSMLYYLPTYDFLLLSTKKRPINA